jgi:hypothetical protein
MSRKAVREQSLKEAEARQSHKCENAVSEEMEFVLAAETR